MPQVGEPKNSEPGQLKNSEINISVARQDERAGRVVEQEARERLEKKAVRVSN